MELKDRLKAAREAAINPDTGKPMTQRYVSVALNVDSMTVSRWELGKSSPDRDTIRELANLYGVSPQSLEFGTASTESFVDTSTADLIPFGLDADMSEACRLAGLSPAGTAQFKSVRFRGAPMGLEALTRLAKVWRATELDAEALAHPKVEEKGQVAMPEQQRGRKLKGR